VHTTLLLLCLHAASLEDDIKTIAATLARPDSFKHDADRARAGIRVANAASTQLWKKMQKADDPRKLLAAPLEALKASLSQNKKAGTPPALGLKVRRTLERDGVQVKMVTFNSTNGLVVTANLYAPVKRPEKMPGIVIIHSHHNPKEQGELQDMGQLWAKAGCYVLVLDQLGHGERRQHPFATTKDFPTKFATSRQDYYFRHNVAAQLQTAGESLVGWMVADISRGVTALLEQPNIDKEKIAILGSVAGGGDPAAVAAALDERITAAAVFNFGGPQPETRFPLPPDAEAAFNYAGGGSWETTRNLAYSASGGFLPWVIVAGVAPRRLIYAHEFAWDEKRDPVWARLKELWAKEKKPGLLRETHGSGSVRGRPPESTHCNNIGAVHRKGIHPAFKEWWGIDGKEPTERKRWTTAELRCLAEKETLTPARKLARELAIKNAVPAEREKLKAHWAKLLKASAVEAPKVKWAEKALTGAIIYSATLSADEDSHVTLFMPDRRKKAPLTVLFGQGGAKVLLAERAAEVVALLKKGEAVAVVDLGGTANMPPGGRGRTSGSTSVAASWLMLGKPLLGERLRTLRQALAALRQRADVDSKRVRLWGGSTAAKAAKAGVVPLEHSQPAHSEPVGPHLALLAALFEDGIVEVRACGGLASWLSILDGPAVYFPYDNIVPGSALADWPSVCKALGTMPVKLERLVDGQNRLVPVEEARKLYAGLKNVTVSK
jgi:dienelactone hydrolase